MYILCHLCEAVACDCWTPQSKSMQSTMWPQAQTQCLGPSVQCAGGVWEILSAFRGNVHTHHADETLVSVSSQYLPLQLSDSSLQSLHGGSRRLLLRYSGGEERAEGRTEKCLVLTLEDMLTDTKQCVKFKVRTVWKRCSKDVHVSVFRWCLTSLEPTILWLIFISSVLTPNSTILSPYYI